MTQTLSAAPIIYPAIDLKEGKCVRLYKGDMTAATIYNDSPEDQARAFSEDGASWLHIVDLNGAFDGKTINGDAVDAVLKTTKLPVQLGGGIRTLENMSYWLEKGVSRLILGTLAVKNPALVREACRLFPGKIAVGLDAIGGQVAVEGWAEASDMEVTDLARKFEDAGVAALIHTDIDRDGTLSGANIAASSALGRAVSIPVIASGGVAGIADIHALVAAGNLDGIITGRALYDGKLDLKEAIAVARGTES